MRGCTKLRKTLVYLAWILILLMMVTTFGCRRGNDIPDPGEVIDPGGDDPGDVIDPGGEDPGGVDPNNDTSLNAPVSLVPASAVDSIDSAVIRQGDLWLCASDGRMWRQTKSGDVSQLVWAPDGHALAYLRITTPNNPTTGLYYLVPGDNSVPINADVWAPTLWLNKNGYIWSPDSSSLAYGIAGSGDLGITQVSDRL